MGPRVIRRNSKTAAEALLHVQQQTVIISRATVVPHVDKSVLASLGWIQLCKQAALVGVGRGGAGSRRCEAVLSRRAVPRDKDGRIQLSKSIQVRHFITDVAHRH